MKLPSIIGAARQLLGSPGDSWTNRTANAGVWAFILSITTQVLRTTRTVVLARFLAPEDFGLMAVAVLALELLDRFSKTGFDQALIQRRGDIEPHMNAAFAISVIRGLALAGLLVLGAPAVESFFRADGATEIVRALAIVPLAAGFLNIGVVTFDKELQFRERFVYRSVPHVIDLVVSVTFAVILKSAWALVIGMIAMSSTMMIASYVVHPFRPGLRIEWRKARELFNFGGWITVSSILLYLMVNLDDIVVGRLLDEASLGLYQMAFTIGTVIVLQLTTVVEKVALPALAMVQDDIDRLRSGFMRIFGLVSAVAIPASFGLAFLSQDIISVLLGDRWLPMLDAFRILLVWGGMRAVAETTYPLFSAIGRPRTSAVIMAWSVVILAIFIYPLTSWGGIEGAALATVIASVPLIAALRIAASSLRSGLVIFVRPLAVPTAGSLMMIAVLFGLSHLLGGGAWALAWAPLAGIGTYVLFLFGARRLVGYELSGIS